MDLYSNGSPQNKRLIKFKNNVKTKLDFFDKKNQLNKDNQPIFNFKLHVPGKINFQELLSIPLEKQIQRENSFKQNQTFCLKFEPETQARDTSTNFYKSENFRNNSLNKSFRFVKRLNQSAQKSVRQRKLSDQFQSNNQIKKASQTMYFRPMGKYSQANKNQNLQRKSLNLIRSKHFEKSKQQNLGTGGFKDKLLMLLQIRKQQRNERKQKRSRSSVSRGQTKSYRSTKNEIRFFDESRTNNQRSNSLREFRKKLQNGIQLSYMKRNHKLKINNQDFHGPNQLSPWHLGENAQEF